MCCNCSAGPCTDEEGSRREDGAEWSPLPCVLCVCRDGQSKCLPRQCPRPACPQVGLLSARHIMTRTPRPGTPRKASTVGYSGVKIKVPSADISKVTQVLSLNPRVCFVCFDNCQELDVVSAFPFNSSLYFLSSLPILNDTCGK